MKLKYHKGWWLYNAILMAVSAFSALISGQYLPVVIGVILAIGFLQGSKIIFWLSLISTSYGLIQRMVMLKSYANASGTDVVMGLGLYVVSLAFLLMLWQQIKKEKKQ